jgi:hypothetical protein
MGKDLSRRMFTRAFVFNPGTIILMYWKSKTKIAACGVASGYNFIL